MTRPVRLTFAVLSLSAATVLGAFAAGCGPSEEPSPAESGPRAEMRRLLEQAARTAGARPTGDLTWFDAETLYDYIDGQAEEFKEAGFLVLAHGEYRPAAPGGGATEPPAEGAYVEVDLYRMTSPEAVAKVMVEPPADARAELAPGVTAYRQEGMREFGAGPYYVRVTARLDPKGLDGLVEALARAVAQAAAEAPSRK